MLKTSCYKCCFKSSEETLCNLGKDVFVDKVFNGTNQVDRKDQFTEGFCRHKRRLDRSDIFSPTLITLENVIKDNQSVSVVISATNNTVDDLVKTVTSLLPIKSDISEIIVVFKQADSDLLNKVASFFNSLQISWKIDNLSLKEDVSPLDAITYGARHATGVWMFSCMSGIVFSEKLLDGFKNINTFTLDNTVLIYRNENDPVNIIVVTTAFFEMGGNVEEPWFNKLKTFENWKKCSVKIQEKLLQ